MSKLNKVRMNPRSPGKSTYELERTKRLAFMSETLKTLEKTPVENLIPTCESPIKLTGLSAKEKNYVKFEILTAKKLKAFEIIKNKSVNVAYLKQAFMWNDDNKNGCEDYNNHFGFDDDGYHSNNLTLEEYELLKETLL